LVRIQSCLPFPFPSRFYLIPTHPRRPLKISENTRLLPSLRPKSLHCALLKPILSGGIIGGTRFRNWGYFQISGKSTDTEIRRSRPAEKAYKLFDSGGLHLLVTPTGGRLWRWKYRFKGTEKLLALGSYPALSLADARERHAKARKQLAGGIDPMAERKAEKTAVKVATEHTFQKIAELWLEHWRGNKSARHSETTRNRLKVECLPGPRRKAHRGSRTDGACPARQEH
jgi:hypothetical protein